MLENLPGAVGHVLRHQRAGLDQIVFHQTPLRPGMAALEVGSLAFADHAPIPARYTADGEGLSPPLHWRGVPASAASVLLIVEDADAPTPHPLVHAIVVDLACDACALAEGALDSPDHDGTGVHSGRHSLLGSGWLPPDPPPGHGTHRYAFQVFALAAGDPFSDKPGREEVLNALASRALASGCLIGTYARPDGSQPADAPAPAVGGQVAPQ
ncbi:YbhB/YbcL family Raf kinase inhibitor-like protein [Aquincola sp. MAHUQ-54]|uniref:YbhB/YbcL family Raf kinase inhibitor-like protein n=1 Tax=Aquincola agrisoli TaxID=3119538 RepID=A0AAW9QKY3_9BURK